MAITSIAAVEGRMISSTLGIAEQTGNERFHLELLFWLGGVSSVVAIVISFSLLIYYWKTNT